MLAFIRWKHNVEDKSYLGVVGYHPILPLLSILNWSLCLFGRGALGTEKMKSVSGVMFVGPISGVSTMLLKSSLRVVRGKSSMVMFDFKMKKKSNPVTMSLTNQWRQLYKSRVKVIFLGICLHTVCEWKVDFTHNFARGCRMDWSDMIDVERIVWIVVRWIADCMKILTIHLEYQIWITGIS